MGGTLVSCCYMIAATAALFLVWRKRPLSLLPKHFGKGYLLATALAAAFLVSTPFITRNTGAGALLSLFYGAVVTVAFEELLFRGWAWKELETLRGGFFPWLGSSLLFGLWHLGYTDTVLWRASLFFPGSDVVNILFWKVVTGLCLGVLFGLLRWKYKNAYAPALLHLAVNAFGSYIARKKRPSPQGRALSYSIEPHSVAEESVMS